MTVLVYPDPAPTPLAKALATADIGYVAVNDVAAATDARPDSGWSGGVLTVELRILFRQPG